jgi:hypothetical protein
LITIQQAATTALARYLQQGLTPDVNVEEDWPDPKRRIEEKTVTVLLAGARQDEPIDIRQLDAIPIGATQTYATYQVKMCTQSIQLDVWTTNDTDRDDILARLDELLNAGSWALEGAYNPDPVGSGLLLALDGAWLGTIADFKWESIGTEDTPDAVNTAEFRATVRGDCFLMLTVSRVTSRQVAIQYALRLLQQEGAADPADPADILIDLTT